MSDFLKTSTLRLPAFVLGVACASAPGHALAGDVLPVIGGPGGGAFSATCPDDERLIGVAVRRGDDLDAIQLLCATANGSRDPHVAVRDRRYGGDGGRPDNIVCAAKTPVVVGLWITFEGGDRDYVNDVGLSCGSPEGRPAGSSPGGPPGMQYCPTGQVAAGLHGRSGAMVDALGLICAAATPPPAPPAPPRTPITSNDRVSATSAALRPASRVGTQATAVTAPVPVTRTRESTTIESDATPPASPPPPPPRTSSRDSLLRAVSHALESNRNEATQDRRADDGNRTGDRPIPGERVEGERLERIPPATPSGRHSLDTADRHGSVQAMLQPEHSVQVTIRYPTAYGYQDANGPGHSGPDSCAAFFIAVRPASGARMDRPIRINTLGTMRRSRDDYACDYLVSDLPFNVAWQMNVAMSDARAAGSVAWLDGSQTRPPAGERRTIVNPGRTIVLTSAIPNAALQFRMSYSGSP